MRFVASTSRPIGDYIRGVSVQRVFRGHDDVVAAWAGLQSDAEKPPSAVDHDFALFYAKLLAAFADRAELNDDARRLRVLARALEPFFKRHLPKDEQRREILRERRCRDYKRWAGNAALPKTVGSAKRI